MARRRVHSRAVLLSTHAHRYAITCQIMPRILSNASRPHHTSFEDMPRRPPLHLAIWQAPPTNDQSPTNFNDKEMMKSASRVGTRKPGPGGSFEGEAQTLDAKSHNEKVTVGDNNL